MRIIFLVLLVLMPTFAWGEDLYLRPVGGAYGSEDGSSYANAFDGWADISWGAGAGSVSAGDTLYICDTHDMTADYFNITASGTAGNKIIIRGDYPSYPGVLDGETGSSAIRLDGADYITLLNFTITDPAVRGISCASPCDYLLVDNVDISGAVAGSGAWLEGAGLVAQNMDLTGCLETGIHVEQAPSAQILFCTVTDGGTVGQNHDGIAMGNDTQGFLIEDCDVLRQAGQSGFDASDNIGAGEVTGGTWRRCTAIDGRWGFHPSTDTWSGQNFTLDTCTATGNDINWEMIIHDGTVTFENCTGSGADNDKSFRIQGDDVIVYLYNHAEDTGAGGNEYGIIINDDDNLTEVYEYGGTWTSEPNTEFGKINGVGKTPAEWVVATGITSERTCYYSTFGVCPMLWYEKFETATSGYNETYSGGETVESGNTLDEDADPSEISGGTPTDWGTQCLQVVGGGTNDDAFVSHAGLGDIPISYLKYDWLVSEEDLADGNSTYIFRMYDSSVAAAYWIDIRQTGANLNFRFYSYHDGSAHSFYGFDNLSLNTVYRIEARWDATANEWEWWVNGTAQANNVDASDPVESPGTLSATHVTGIDRWNLGNDVGTQAITMYFDNFFLDDDTQIGTALAGDQWEERFEGNGTDESWGGGLIETTAIRDLDASPADVGSPPGWGDKCMKIVDGSGAVNSRLEEYSFGPYTKSYVRVEVVVSATASLENEDSADILRMFDDSWALAYILDYYNDSSSNRWLRISSYHDGSSSTYLSFDNTVIGDFYRIEVLWDADTNVWDWWINGTKQANDQDASDPVTSSGTLTATHVPDIDNMYLGSLSASGADDEYTFYLDNFGIATSYIGLGKADWIHDLPGLENAKIDKWNGVEIENLGRINGLE